MEKSLKKNLSDIFDLSLKINQIYSSPLLKEKENDCNTINDIYKAFSDLAFTFANDDNILFEHIDELINYLLDIIERVSSIQEYIYKKYSSNKDVKDLYREENNKLLKIINELSELEDYYNNTDIIAGKRENY